LFVGYTEAYNLIRMYPPLTIKEENVDELCNALEYILGGGINEQH
jgi:4-aminobutyrate aminotransferase-like enzyme